MTLTISSLLVKTTNSQFFRDMAANRQYQIDNEFKLNRDYGFALTRAIQYKRLKSQIEVTYANRLDKLGKVVVFGHLKFPMPADCGCNFEFNHDGGNKDRKTAWVKIVLCPKCAYQCEALFSSDEETPSTARAGAQGFQAAGTSGLGDQEGLTK